MHFRILIILLPFFTSVNAWSQTNFKKQVRSIIADSASGFQQLKRVDSLRLGDSIYSSMFQIGGTSENEIFKVSESVWIYSALIIKESDKKKAIKICDEWKEKLEITLGSLFKVSKFKIVSFSPSIYGWRLADDNVIVSIDIIPAKVDGRQYTVWLSFMN